MSYGSLSGRAVEALNKGAARAGCWQGTGEGGMVALPGALLAAVEADQRRPLGERTAEFAAQVNSAFAVGNQRTSTQAVEFAIHQLVAIAVRAGAPRPDIGSEDAVRNAVRHARSVSYSTGPSGDYLAKLFERWGGADDAHRLILEGVARAKAGK